MMKQVTSPAHVIWSTDTTSQRLDRSFWAFIPAYRHGGSGWDGTTNYENKTRGVGFNCVFVDGHVEWILWPRFLAWAYGVDGVAGGGDDRLAQKPYSWF